MVSEDPPVVHEKPYFEAFLWGAVLGTVLVVSFTWMAALYWKETREFSLRKDMELIEIFGETQKESDLSMVLFGNSRLRHAATFGFFPDKKVTLPDGRTMAVVQYGIDAGSYNHFEHLIEPVLEIRPDYLVIVRNLLTNNTASEDRANQTFFFAQLVFHYINRAFRYHIPADYNWTIDRRGVDSTCFADFTKERLLQRINFGAERDRHMLDGPETQKMRKLIENARSRGIRVVILDLPPPVEKVRVYGKKRHHLGYPGLGFYPEAAQMLPVQHKDVLWLDYQVPADITHFCDFTHLSKTGRQVFSNWFLDWVIAQEAP